MDDITNKDWSLLMWGTWIIIASIIISMFFIIILSHFKLWRFNPFDSVNENTIHWTLSAIIQSFSTILGLLIVALVFVFEWGDQQRQELDKMEWNPKVFTNVLKKLKENFETEKFDSKEPRLFGQIITLYYASKSKEIPVGELNKIKDQDIRKKVVEWHEVYSTDLYYYLYYLTDTYNKIEDQIINKNTEPDEKADSIENLEIKNRLELNRRLLLIRKSINAGSREYFGFTIGLLVLTIISSIVLLPFSASDNLLIKSLTMLIIIVAIISLGMVIRYVDNIIRKRDTKAPL